MPVKIACPKCSKNYTLPDSALGKAVKCKACGTAFRTKGPAAGPSTPAKPSPGQQRPAQQKPAQPVRPDPNEFGLDGGFQKQADIFGAPPQGSAGLQNVAEKDPFGDAVEPIVLGPAGAASAPPDNPFQSVMTNSSMRGNSTRKKSRKKKRGKVGATDVSEYGIVRAGMMCVFGAGGAMLFTSFAFLLMSILLQVLASDGNPPPKALAAVLGVIALLLFGLVGISMLALVIGQIMCMFAPNGNERLNSIGSAALVFFAMVGGFVVTLILGVAIDSLAGPGGLSGGGVLSIGLGYLAFVLICAAMMIAAVFMFINFYRRVGKNIKSDALITVSNQATIAVCISMAVTIGLILTGYLLGISGVDPKTIGATVGVAGLLNSLFSLVVAAVMLRMVWTGISSLKS